MSSIEIGTSCVGAARLVPLITFAHVDTGSDAMVIEGGAVSPTSALCTASTRVHAVLWSSVNTVPSLKGAWLGIEVLTLVKIVHTRDSAPARVTLTALEARRFIGNAVSTGRLAQQSLVRLAPSNVGVLVLTCCFSSTVAMTSFREKGSLDSSTT